MTRLSERCRENGAPLVILVGLTLCVCGFSLFARVRLSGRGVLFDSLICYVLPSSVLSRLQSSVSPTLLLRQPGQPDRRTGRPFYCYYFVSASHRVVKGREERQTGRQKRGQRCSVFGGGPTVNPCPVFV